jgi:hypothetical protein
MRSAVLCFLTWIAIVTRSGATLMYALVDYSDHILELVLCTVLGFRSRIAIGLDRLAILFQTSAGNHDHIFKLVFYAVSSLGPGIAIGSGSLTTLMYTSIDDVRHIILSMLSTIPKRARMAILGQCHTALICTHKPLTRDHLFGLMLCTNPRITAGHRMRSFIIAFVHRTFALVVPHALESVKLTTASFLSRIPEAVLLGTALVLTPQRHQSALMDVQKITQ